MSQRCHMTFPNPAVSLRQMRGLLKRRRKHLLRGGSVSLAREAKKKKVPLLRFRVRSTIVQTNKGQLN